MLEYLSNECLVGFILSGFIIHSLKIIQMKFYRIFFFLFIFLMINACKSSSPEKTVENFYTKHLQTYDFRKADSALLSFEINQLIKEVVKRENLSAEELKSINSTDKPDMIEGDLFTSSYEGAKSFKIISSELYDSIALVKVEFTYIDNKWIDEVSLSFVDNRWLLSDVKYGQSYLQGTLKNSLMAFNQLSPPIVGGDKDEHGCIGSAGYTWSQLKQTCIRSFELPIQLLNPEGTITAGLHFSDDLSKAELFLPDGLIPLLKIETNKYKFLVDRKTVGVLNKNQDKWEFFIVGSDVVYKEK